VKKTRIKEPLVLVIPINLKELAGLMKGIKQELVVSGQLFDFLKE
jgi:hypothetical protein